MLTRQILDDVKRPPTKNEIKPETKVSLDIKLTAEVEKIWILHNLDDLPDCGLHHDDIKHYCKTMITPSLILEEHEWSDIYNTVDYNGDQLIDKEERYCLL